jgi:hypothetical protein
MIVWMEKKKHSKYAYIKYNEEIWISRRKKNHVDLPERKNNQIIFAHMNKR